MKEIKIGLLGCGTVGTGVAKLLIENRKLIRDRVGADLILKRVADIDIKRDRGINFDDKVLTTDADAVLDDSEIDIIIEMIGGEGVAREFILKAIANGKQVVTANKALLAIHGDTIFQAAIQKGVDLAFEASVGGCMPIIKTIRESLVGNHIKSIFGILNGTCNYILSKITDSGGSFEDALAQAKANGFAEADPTLDIEGIDTAHKLAILIFLAYGVKINFNDIFIEGISKITPIDIEFAKQFDLRIKLLLISKHKGNAIEARVHPTMIPQDNILSSVNGSMNAVTISGDAIDNMVLYGHGAGMLPTASAVISDTVDLARNLMSDTRGRIPILSYQFDNIKKIQVMPIDELSTYYYFRFSISDRPGVLAKIAGVLGNYGISLKYVTQRGPGSQGCVPIVMLTHLAREAEVKKALAEIARLDVVSDTPVLIRIEADNELI